MADDVIMTGAQDSASAAKSAVIKLDDQKSKVVADMLMPYAELVVDETLLGVIPKLDGDAVGSVAEDRMAAVQGNAEKNYQLLCEYEKAFKNCLDNVELVYKSKDKDVLYEEDFSVDENELVQVTIDLADSIKSLVCVSVVNDSDEAYNKAFSAFAGVKERCNKVANIDYAKIVSEADARKEYAEIVSNPSKYSCEELYEKYLATNSLVSAEFREYEKAIFEAKLAKEKAIMPELEAAVDNATIETIYDLMESTQKDYYSAEFKSYFYNKCNSKKNHLELFELDKLVNSVDANDRQQLIELYNVIAEQKFGMNLKSEYQGKVYHLIIEAEDRELDSLCMNVESVELSDIATIENIISTGGYHPEVTEKYLTRIANRKRVIHLRNMEGYVQGVEKFTRNEMNVAYNRVNGEDCDINLKLDFLNRLDKRKEEIEYEELCEMTSGLNSKSTEELLALFTDLKSGEYNRKFVNKFITKVRVAYEMHVHKDYCEKLAAIPSGDKAGYLSLKNEILADTANARITADLLSALDNNIFVCDFNTLVATANSFDNLDLNGVKALREKINGMDVCQKGRGVYLTKLRRRELVIGMKNVDKVCGYLYALINSYGMQEEAKVPIYSPDYMQYYMNHIQLMRHEDLMDMPILILPQCSSLTFAKSCLYYIQDGTFYKLDYARIYNIESVKKLLTMNIKVVFNDGNFIEFSSGVNKNNFQYIINLMCAAIWYDRNVVQSYKEYTESVAPFKADEYVFTKDMAPLDESAAFRTLHANFGKDAASFGELPYVKAYTDPNWQSINAKIYNAFAIPQNEQTLMYYDDTFMSRGKNALLLTSGGIHVNNNGTNYKLEIADIHRVAFEGALNIYTNANMVYSFPLKMEGNQGMRFAKLIGNFIEGKQTGIKLFQD